MRKYIIGILIGFCLSFAVGAHAEIANMIGKTIDGEFYVTVNGNKLPVKAITSDGTSYVPLRSFGESQGFKVTFDADMGVSMAKISDPAAKEAGKTVTELKPKIIIKNPVWDGEIDLENADAAKKSMQEKIEYIENELRIAKSSNKSAVLISDLEKGLQNFKDAITDLERQKAQLTK